MLAKYVHKLSKSFAELNPDRIYIENMRSIFGTNTKVAKIICELAVKKGYFEKYYAVECLNMNCGRVIKSFNSFQDIPEIITCTFCEDEGEETYSFKKSELNIVPFYKYIVGSYEFA